MGKQEETISVQIEGGDRIRLIGNFSPLLFRAGAFLKCRGVYVNLAFDAVNYQSQKIPGSSRRESNYGKIIFGYLHRGRDLIPEDSCFLIRVGSQDMMIAA